MDTTDKDIAACERELLALDRLGVARLMDERGSESLLARIERVLIPALTRIGCGWELGSVALSQVYMSGRIAEELIDRLLPSADTQRLEQPRMALAVLEDYHLLGKRMVYAIMRAAGYRLLDYGRTDAETLVRRVVEDRVELLLISTLMLPSAFRVSRVREGLVRSGRSVKIIVGGAPFRFDDQLWLQVGADAMCRNASDVPATITALCGGTP